MKPRICLYTEDEIARVTPSGFISLNNEAVPTNTNVNGPEPYDHVMYRQDSTSEMDDEFDIALRWPSSWPISLFKFLPPPRVVRPRPHVIRDARFDCGCYLERAVNPAVECSSAERRLGWTGFSGSHSRRLGFGDGNG